MLLLDLKDLRLTPRPGPGSEVQSSRNAGSETCRYARGIGSNGILNAIAIEVGEHSCSGCIIDYRTERTPAVIEQYIHTSRDSE